MAITDIVLSGKIYQDDGDAVNGATVALLETGTSTQEATTTSDSNGAWSFTSTSLDATYDIKITSGTSVRYILWSDEITTKGVDTASLKVRGVEGAAAPIYLFADQADDAGDGWRIQASASDTLAIGSDKASAGTIIDYLTITNGANAAASVVAAGGDLTVGDDLSLTSDSAVFNMGAGNDFTITHDGTTGATIAGNPLTLDSGADIVLDAEGADVILKDGGTQYGSLTNSSSNLLIKSGSTTAATFSGANVTFAGTVDATTDFTVGSTVITDDSIVMTPSASDTVTIAGATHGILNVTTVDAAGTAADVNIDADGEIVIDAADAAGAIFKIAGTAQLSVIDGAILPTTDNDIDLGSSSYQFKDAYINGTLEADAVTIGGTNVVTGSLITTLGTISAGVWQGTAITGDYINDDIISGQAEITSGLAAADEFLYSDAGTVKRVGLDTLTTYLAGVNAGTVTSTGLSDSSGVISLDIQNMTASSTIADADLIVVDDGAGGTLRKMTRADFIESAALDDINIDGGAIDGTVIGANSAAAGTFAAVAGTTGTFSGVLDITDTTDSSDASGDTGALRTEGGASIAKKLYVGTDASVLGAFYVGAGGNEFSITESSDDITIKSLISDKDLKISGNDGGSNVDALSFDMSAGGAATFATQVTLTNGSLVVGNNNGIDFSATGGPDAGSGTSELLDDYEEGTFSPTILPSSGAENAGGYHATPVGKYTKIGRLVNVSIVLENGTDSVTTTDTIEIAGLPFTPASGNWAASVGLGDSLAITAGHSLGAFVLDATARIRLMVWDATTGMTQMTYGELSNRGYLIVSASYNV
jgi:hypothetical protein